MVNLEAVGHTKRSAMGRNGTFLRGAVRLE
jgi:hypothetical protein